MKTKINKLIASVLLCLPIVSCVDDLNQYPHVEETSASVYTTVDGYKAVLGKLYASFVIAGQEQGGGNVDISSNTGYDYMRCYFNLQEAGTDEVACTWLEGENIANLTYLSWDANDPWVSDMYYRIYFTITLSNELIRNASEAAIAVFTAEEQAEIEIYRNEARFLRALAYYHAMDLFRNIPFVTENDPVGAYAPPRYEMGDVFEYIESELKDIEGNMVTAAGQEYGRASQAAVWTLLAKIYLNAEVYTNEARYTDCIAYCQKVMGAGFSLEPDYKKLFNADNHLRTNEIIFSFPVDADHSTSWGATTYVICGGASTSKDESYLNALGIDGGWDNLRLRGNIPNLFSDGDGRALFYTEGQSMSVTTMSDASNGYLTTKWSNLTDAGEKASNTASYGVNTDFPVFRLADVYLMLAESVLRGGSGSDMASALGAVNLLQERAFGEEYQPVVNLTTDFILAERARELLWECTRRTDLIRHNKFTSNSYLWEWKGGVKDGKAVDLKYNYYPIPTTDLTANPNLFNTEY